MESDNDTLEFEIEIVSSSSSISLASNSLADLDSSQPANDKTKPFIEPAQALNNHVESSDVQVEQLTDERIHYIQIEGQSLLTSIPSSNKQQDELRHRSSSLSREDAKNEDKRDDLQPQAESNSIIEQPRDNMLHEVAKAEELKNVGLTNESEPIEGEKTIGPGMTKAQPNESRELESPVEVTTQIPLVEYEIELTSPNVIDVDESQIELIIDLNKPETGKTVPQEIAPEPITEESTVESLSSQPPADEAASRLKSSETSNQVPFEEHPHYELVLATSELIKKRIQGFEIRYDQQIESVTLPSRLEVEPAKQIVTKQEHPSTEAEAQPVKEVIIEPQNSSDHLQSDNQEVKFFVEAAEDLPTRPEIEDDLEREFDEEPEFERRDVKLKRGCDPRSEYELGDELGKGRFGTVVRCVEQASGRKLAAKFVHMRRKEDRDDVEREIAIMCKLQHKRLLQLYDAFDDGQTEMCLITELIEGGELFERIIDDDFELTEKKAAIFMRQICEGVQYMHSQRIVHLDMKPENILCISKTGNRIKLIDFGLARHLAGDEPLRVMFGTPDFAAPEVLAYDVVTLATDMWSVGVICYVLLSGLSPFMGDNDIETMANVTRATYDFDDASFDPISDMAKDFISKLLVKNPEERLKPDECLEHPWLQKGGIKLEAAMRERRQSNALALSGSDTLRLLEAVSAANNGENATAIITQEPLFVSLDKRNLKRYVVRRKWHKTVHAIMALGRMGANLKFKLSADKKGL